MIKLFHLYLKMDIVDSFVSFVYGIVILSLFLRLF